MKATNYSFAHKTIVLAMAVLFLAENILLAVPNTMLAPRSGFAKAGGADSENISSGTITQAHHEGSPMALDEQLSRVFDQLREIYNHHVPPAVKESIRHQYAMDVRELIPDSGPQRFLTEMEADLAQVFMGLITQEEFKILQQLRKKMKQTTEYSDAVGKMGKAILIFFTPTMTQTELFWVEDAYAAGHSNREGSRIHVSLPLALADAAALARGAVQSPSRMLSVEIAQHEAIHIAQGRHDTRLDDEIAQIATQDRNRPKVKDVPIRTLAISNGFVMKASRVVTMLDATQNMGELYSSVARNGWHSVALSVNNLPEDLSTMLDMLKISSGDREISFLEIIKMAADEIILAPFLMVYSPAGEKIDATVLEAEVDPHEFVDVSYKPKGRVLLLSLLNPSDAFVTGHRIQFADLYELSHTLVHSAARHLIARLAQEDRIEASYGGAYRQARDSQCLGREYLQASIRFLTENFSGNDRVAKRIQNLRLKYLQAAEKSIRGLNQALVLADDDMEFPAELLGQIMDARDGKLAPGGNIGKRARLVAVVGTIAKVRDSHGVVQDVPLTEMPHMELFSGLNAKKMQLYLMAQSESTGNIVDGFFNALQDESSLIFYVFDKRVEDFSGFAFSKRKIIALHSSLEHNPIALFHEIGEFAYKQDLLHFHFEDRKTGQEILKLEIRGERFELRLSGDELAIARQGPKDPHYLLRAMQRVLFGDRDKTLERIIQQWKTAASVLEKSIAQSRIDGLLETSVKSGQIDGDRNTGNLLGQAA